MGIMFTLAQLRCFVVLAEELNFRRAARRLNMSQPPLTRHIQTLEHEVGALLLDRSRRAIRLTPAGVSFASRAARLLEEAADASRQARQIASGDAGEVVISFTAAASYVFLPWLVALLRRKHPEIALTLRELTTPQQLVALTSRQVDICLLRPPIALPGVRTLRVQRECLVAAVPETHRLATQESVELNQLSGELLITYPPIEGPYFHGMVTGLLQAGGVYPSDFQYITQTHGILTLVAAGIGIGVVPQSGQACLPRGAKLLPLAGAENVHVDLVMAWPVESGNHACATVVRTIAQHL